MQVEHATRVQAATAEQRVHSALARAGKLGPTSRVVMVTDPRGLFGATPGDVFVTLFARAHDCGSVCTWLVTAIGQVIDPRAVSPHDLWAIANG